ncbi:unnamed protein product, partial [Pocillopora meandrina]
LPDKKDTIREESRRLSRPRSLKSFRKEKRDGDVTSAAACSKVATTKVNAAPLAPLSGVVGKPEKKKEAKAGADTKGNSSQAVSCRGRNKTRSGPTKVKGKLHLHRCLSLRGLPFLIPVHLNLFYLVLFQPVPLLRYLHRVNHQ